MNNELAPPDKHVPSLERQADLEAEYVRRRILKSVGAYSGVWIRTYGELNWIMQRRNWSGEPELPEGMQRANLSWARFSSTNLSGVNLVGANLSAANLMRANLRSTNLECADLSAAYFEGTLITDTRLAHSLLAKTSFRDVQGAPHWPAMGEEDWHALLKVVISPTTPAHQLKEMIWQWPGLLLQDHIAANPNTPVETLRELAPRQPLSFVRNPVLPLLFLENPLWLNRYEARNILQVIAQKTAELTPDDLKIVQLIENCAQ